VWYEALTVEDMAACFVSALERLMYPTRMRESIQGLFTVPMQTWLQVLGNCISRARILFRCLGPQHAHTHPEAVAIEAGSRRIAYAELDGLASLVAAALKDVGAGPARSCACMPTAISNGA